MYVTHTAYPALRASLAADYVELSDEQLDWLVADVYGPGVTAEDVESFWRDVGRGFQSVARGVSQVAQQAAPVVARTLPGIAQGALTGASVGGPFGAIAGALAGGAGSALSQSRNRTLRGIGGAIGGVGQLASSFTGGGALANLARVGLGALGRGGGSGALANLAGSALGALQGAGGRGAAGALGALAAPALGALQQPGGVAGAIGQLAGAVAPQVAGARGGRGGSANALLGLLSRPETVRALLSASMGQYGRPSVMLGTQPVAVQSIMNAIGSLAGRAAAEAEAAADGETLPAYFYSADGELAIDPADTDERADALLELYAWTPAPMPEAGPSEHAWREPEYTDEDAMYDEWLLATEAEWLDADEQEATYA
jgi:hypothetical protein